MSKNDGKRKERKAVIEKYLGGLFARTEGYARNVSRYYTAAVEALLDLAATADMEPDEVFHFSDHKRMSVKATNILRGLYSAIYQEIRRGVKAEWEYANLSADAMIMSLFGKGVMEDNHFARWFARNQEAMDSFFSRKDSHGGLNLSQKVWKYTGQFKEEMELALSASLGQGDSASTVSRHVRQYLREPDRLFRRIRDAEGNLKLSKRAAAYHPGRGEYRSSYKNAMRLTRTETNMAYRAADCDRWSRIPFVVGMEVKRSNNPFGCDVCEALKGKYPKDFVFTGWHPQCRCYIVPVLASEEERMAYHRAVLNGEDVSDFHFKGEITEPHEGFRKWMSENQERIEGARSLPYWMRDNGKYVSARNTTKGNHASREEKADTKGEKENSTSGITASEKALIAEESVAVKHNTQEIFNGKDFKEAKDVSDVLNKINEILPKEEKWSVNGDFSLRITDDSSVNGKTSRDGIIFLTKERLDRVQATFRKIARGQAFDITKEEADAMATLWHEIVHNRHVGLESAGEKHSVSERCMELANEWYARHNLKVFYGHLGLNKVPFPEYITHRKSTAYDLMVKNFDHVIGIMRLERKEVMASLENSLFKGKYDDMENGLYKALFDGGMKNLNDVVLPEDQAKELLSFIIKSTPEDITDWLTENNYLASK